MPIGTQWHTVSRVLSHSLTRSLVSLLALAASRYMASVPAFEKKFARLRYDENAMRQTLDDQT